MARLQSLDRDFTYIPAESEDAPGCFQPGALLRILYHQPYPARCNTASLQHMPNLILLRHGQSQWNLENRFTGWVDVDLSELGRARRTQPGRSSAA